MGKKVTVSLSITYDFRGEVLAEYEAWLDGERDTRLGRKWFVIDRFIGHDNLDTLLGQNVIDRNAKIKVEEKK